MVSTVLGVNSGETILFILFPRSCVGTSCKTLCVLVTQSILGVVPTGNSPAREMYILPGIPGMDSHGLRGNQKKKLEDRGYLAPSPHETWRLSEEGIFVAKHMYMKIGFGL